jgi:hypothetical protein
MLCLVLLTLVTSTFIRSSSDSLVRSLELGEPASAGTEAWDFVVGAVVGCVATAWPRTTRAKPSVQLTTPATAMIARVPFILHAAFVARQPDRAGYNDSVIYPVYI